MGELSGHNPCLLIESHIRDNGAPKDKTIYVSGELMAAIVEYFKKLPGGKIMAAATDIVSEYRGNALVVDGELTGMTLRTENARVTARVVKWDDPGFLSRQAPPHEPEPDDTQW